MNELIWRTEIEMQDDVDNEGRTRDRSIYGRDGHTLAATGEFEYKGMKYIINVLRYYVLKDSLGSQSFCPMGSRQSEYFANLEYSDSMKDIVDMVKFVRDSGDFLYNDSLHSYSDNMDIDEQVAEMHKRAKEDIDSLPELYKDIENKILALEEVKRQISAMKIYGDMNEPKS